MGCQAGTVLRILWNTKHFPMLVENTYIIWFEYTEFHIFINPFTAIIGNWQMCVRYISEKSASSPHRDEMTTDLTLFNMKNDTFLLLSSTVLAKMTGEFPAQRASNEENVSVRWRHHDISQLRTDINYKLCVVQLKHNISLESLCMHITTSLHPWA